MPFTSVKVQFDGAKGVLTSPPTCGPNATTHAMTAWSGTPDRGPAGQRLHPDQSSRRRCLRENAGGAALRAGLRGSSRKATPAATFTPFSARITRADGQQELKGVDITLPPGATAKLAGVPYCPPTAIAAAAASSGAAERPTPAAPTKARIGGRHGRRRQRPLAAADRRQGLPRRPLQRGAALAGGRHPGRRRPLRPRHRGGPGAALPRSRDGADPRRLRRDPGRLRRRQARHPLDLGQRQQGRVHPQRDQLLANSPPPARSRAGVPTRPTRPRSRPSRSPLPFQATTARR